MNPALSLTMNQVQHIHGVSGTPNEARLRALIDKTGYPMLQENGQRKLGPPPHYDGPIPKRGNEVFIGKIPRDCYEDELFPLFLRMGSVFEFRLMMDFSGFNRGFAFCTYINRLDAKRAIKELNNYEVKKGRFLGVVSSVDNCRLFVGGIPKCKKKHEILAEMKSISDCVVDVIVYPSALDKSKNRGFAFVEYDNHKAAAMARRKLLPGRVQLWGQQIAVDWADPEPETDEETMAMVSHLLKYCTFTFNKQVLIIYQYSSHIGIKLCKGLFKFKYPVHYYYIFITPPPPVLRFFGQILRFNKKVLQIIHPPDLKQRCSLIM